MKLSDYAKKNGIGYRTAWNHYKLGWIPTARKLPSGIIEEYGSGFNDNRKKFRQFLLDKTITRLVVEHKDRLTQFGFNYLKDLWHGEIVIINEVVEDEKDLRQDFVSLVTFFTAKLCGKKSP